MQDPERPRVIQVPPDDLSFAGTMPEAPGERPPLRAEVFDRGRGRPGAPERGKEGPQGLVHPLIGVEDDAAGGIID